jgi:hypothetical protein
MLSSCLVFGKKEEAGIALSDDKSSLKLHDQLVPKRITHLLQMSGGLRAVCLSEAKAWTISKQKCVLLLTRLK